MVAGEGLAVSGNELLGARETNRARRKARSEGAGDEVGGRTGVGEGVDFDA